MKSNIPKIGFGTYRLKGETCFNAVTDALSCGYKLLDTAEVYDNEEQVGKAISASSIPKDKGLIRSIGVTSFTLEELNELVFITGIIPDLVQVECHPFLQQKALQERVESLGSTFQAWFPLGSGDQKLFNNPILKSIALSHHVTVPAIILAWHIQEGHSVVVRSTKINHMKDNLNLH